MILETRREREKKTGKKKRENRLDISQTQFNYATATNPKFNLEKAKKKKYDKENEKEK